MEIKLINPWNLEEIASYESMSEAQASDIVAACDERFQSWRKTSYAERSALMKAVAALLIDEADRYAEVISLEMGKPINEARAEVKKCAWVCEYYADHAEEFLQPRTVETDASKSLVRYDPLGVIYAIMPWNFPFWQVFRFAAPTLMAGNTAVLKHAPNSTKSALLIEEIFSRAGFPSNAFRTVILDNDTASAVIKHPKIRAVSLTGSERAGEAVASTAGSVLKPSLLELGGSNAVIVRADADVAAAVETGFNARFLNSGQSCIAGKRFLVHTDVFDEYLERFTAKVKELRAGNPLDEDTTIGPLARVDLAEGIEKQVNQSIEKGAELVCGGNRNGAFYEPTVLTNVRPGMPAFDEELFGPVAPFVRITSDEEATELSNQSAFGLGVSILTADTDKALEMASELNEGAVFINELVKSDPRLPFGGIKRSGYGRELSREGILAFVNAKTVYVK